VCVCVCVFGTLYTLESTLAICFQKLHSIFTQCQCCHGKHFQCVIIIIIIIVNIIVLSSCVHASIAPFSLGQDKELQVFMNFSTALRSNCQWDIVRFLFCTIYVCCFVVVYFSMSDLLKCVHCARAVNATCRSRLPSLLFTVLL